MNNKLIMQSLPLVAAVLGNKYGVRVSIGGTKAFTDGNTVCLPGLPIDSDETLKGLARGYIDHESAHIRETDFDAVRKASLTPLEKNIWNCIEDWRVEIKLSLVYPGCRSNFNWLIRHLFKDTDIDERSPPANLIPNWILLTVRSWHVGDISAPRDEAEAIIDKSYPGLCGKIKLILHDVQSTCNTTDDSISSARKIVSLLKNETKEKPRSKTQSDKGNISQKRDENSPPESSYRDGENQLQKAEKQLEKLINASSDELPENVGKVIADNLTRKASSDCQDRIQAAVIGKRLFKPLDSANSSEVARSTAALKTRMQSMMQSVLLKRSRTARQGKLDTRQLYRITVSDPRMFIKPEERQGVSTAVHILLDCSASMRRRMELTTQTCYALAKALDSVRGINVGVTAFPAQRPLISGCQCQDIRAVCPVIRHGERIHSGFQTNAYGCTPMGEAVWWVLQQMVLLTESRKIVLIITDGQPDSLSNTLEAVRQGRRLGVEFYGIGIDTDSMKNILPHSSCSINNLSELALSMFGIMKNVFNHDR